MKYIKVLFLTFLILIILSFAFYNIANKKPNKPYNSLKHLMVDSKSQTDKKEEIYSVKPNIIYYVLTDEYFENNDKENPNLSELVRQYMCYDGIKNNIYPDTRVIALDKVSNVFQFREKILKENASALKLPPNTIVNSNVSSKWEMQSYDVSSSYSEKSPKGLTLSKLK